MSTEIIDPPSPSPRSLSLTVVTVIGLLVLFAPAVAFGLGARAKAIENRPLAERPALGDGWLVFPKTTAWATDRLPLREQAIDLNDGLIERVFGQPPVNAASSGPAVGGPDAGGSLENLFPKVIEGRDGWLYFGSDTKLPCLATRPVGDTVAALIALRDVLEKSGRRFVFVVAPDKSTMVPEHLPGDYPGKGCARERKAEMRGALADIDGAETWLVDLRRPLLERQAADGVDIYRPNDTHWTPRGGAVFGQELFAILAPRLTSYADVVATGVRDRPGDLAVLLGRSTRDRYQTWELRRPGVVSPVDPPEPGPIPAHVQSSTTGSPLFTPSTLLFGDSFTAASRPLLYPLFADLTVLHSQSGLVNMPRAVAAFASADVVVIEVVERDLVSNELPILSPELRAAVAAALR